MSAAILFGLVAGLLLCALDGILNGNPLARRLLSAYAPIARERLPIIAGTLVDLGFGVAIAFIYQALYPSLPGGSGLEKGLAFGGIAWFLRSVTNAASQWVMFKLPLAALAYLVAAGLVEMLAIGLVLGVSGIGG